MMKRDVVRLLLVGVIALTASIGCAPPPAGADQAAVDSQTLAPEFTLSTPDGKQVSLSDSAGKVRLLDFWATWCAPCREEIPFLNQLQAKYGERGFEVIAISDEAGDVIAEFMAEHDVKYTNLIGNDDVSEAYQVLGLPAAYLLDAEGRVVSTFMGPKPEGLLERKIDDLLAARPAT